MNGPPWVLNCPALAITRPQPPPIPVTLSPQPPITVPWPRYQVTGAEPPAPPQVIRLTAPPQAPCRTPLPPVVAYLLSNPP